MGPVNSIQDKVLGEMLASLCAGSGKKFVWRLIANHRVDQRSPEGRWLLSQIPQLSET